MILIDGRSGRLCSAIQRRRHLGSGAGEAAAQIPRRSEVQQQPQPARLELQVVDLELPLFIDPVRRQLARLELEDGGVGRRRADAGLCQTEQGRIDRFRGDVGDQLCTSPKVTSFRMPKKASLAGPCIRLCMGSTAVSSGVGC